MHDIILITPDPERAKSMLNTSKTTLKRLKSTDQLEFPSDTAKDYYDCIRELMTAIMLLDGKKAIGEYAHKRTIEYIAKNHSILTRHEADTIDRLRIIRNDIAYEGKTVDQDYIIRNQMLFNMALEKLAGEITRRIKS